MTVTELISRLKTIESDGKGCLKIVIDGKEPITVMIQSTSDGLGEYVEVVS